MILGPRLIEGDSSSAKTDLVALAIWLIVPSLWLSVWLLACALRASELSHEESREFAPLGWLPTLVATLLTSLYLPSRVWLSRFVSTWWLHLAALGIAVVFISTQVYLGQWTNGLMAGLVLLVGELQGRLVGSVTGRANSSQISPSNAPAATEVAVSETVRPTNSAAQFSATANRSAMMSPVTREFEPAAMDLASEANGVNIGGVPSPMAATRSDAGDESVATESGEVESEGGDSDEEPETTPANWVQQMTRTIVMPISKDPNFPAVVHERVEWFYRYHWQPTERQVDLHVVYQPPFAGKPVLHVEVVEGVGQVSIGDSVPHGTRLQLKRAKGNDLGDYTVVWLQASGPV